MPSLPLAFAFAEGAPAFALPVAFTRALALSQPLPFTHAGLFARTGFVDAFAPAFAPARSFLRGGFRRWRRKQALEQRFAEAEALAREEGPAGDGIMNETHMHVERALMALPETLRAPVVLRYMEGLSLQQVADTLGLRLSAAKMRVQRGRERLSALLRNAGDEGEKR